MPKKAQIPIANSEIIGNSQKTLICSDSLELSPNLQGKSEHHPNSPFPSILGRPTETKGSISGESAKYPESQTEVFGKSAQAPNSSRSQPEARQIHIFSKTSKPQIATTPGLSPKERNRYRVIFGTEILGDKLSLDEALKLAKRGKHG